MLTGSMIVDDLGRAQFSNVVSVVPEPSWTLLVMGAVSAGVMRCTTCGGGCSLRSLSSARLNRLV